MVVVVVLVVMWGRVIVAVVVELVMVKVLAQAIFRVPVTEVAELPLGLFKVKFCHCRLFFFLLNLAFQKEVGLSGLLLNRKQCSYFV